MFGDNANNANNSANVGAGVNIAMPRWKRTAILAAGFGFGGLLWGLEAYRGTVGTDDAFVSPFSFVLGAVAMGVFGGLAVATVKKIERLNGSTPFSRLRLFDKEMAKIIGLSLVAWLGAFGVSLVISAKLYPLDGIPYALVLAPFVFIANYMPSWYGIIIDSIRPILEPSLFIGVFAFEFFIIGGITGIFCYFVLHRRSRVVIYAALAFSLMAIISPSIGNSLGEISKSVLVSYIFTFIFLGVAMGIGIGLAFSKDANSSTKENKKLT